MLKQIMLDQKQSLQSYEIEPRAYPIDTELNYVFVGVRRAGKSYIMYQTIRQLMADGQKIAKVLPCRRRTIITCDTTDTLEDEHGKIEVVPCWKWGINESK